MAKRFDFKAAKEHPSYREKNFVPSEYPDMSKYPAFIGPDFVTVCQNYVLSHVPSCASDAERINIRFAVGELTSNAINHGNMDDNSLPVNVGTAQVGKNFIFSVQDTGHGKEYAAKPREDSEGDGIGLLTVWTFLGQHKD